MRRTALPVWRHLDYWLNRTSLRLRGWIWVLFALLLIAAVIVVSSGMVSWGEQIIEKAQ